MKSADKPISDIETMQAQIDKLIADLEDFKAALGHHAPPPPEPEPTTN